MINSIGYSNVLITTFTDVPSTREEPIIRINSESKNILGNNEIIVVGGSKPLFDVYKDTIIENVHITTVDNIYKMKSKNKLIKRLKYLITNNIEHLIIEER